MTAHIQVIGASAARSQLKRINIKLEKQNTANHKAVIFLDRWIQRNFQAEGAPTGERWKPLAASTIAGRRTGPNKSLSHKILQDTGALKGRWKHFWNDKYGLIRSNMPYAIFHDSPEPRRGKLPRRQILPDEKHVIKDLIKIFDGFVRNNLR